VPNKIHQNLSCQKFPFLFSFFFFLATSSTKLGYCISMIASACFILFKTLIDKSLTNGEATAAYAAAFGLVPAAAPGNSKLLAYCM